MGLIVANNNATITLGGRVIAALVNFQFGITRDAKETTAIDNAGWRTYVAGLKGGASLTGTIRYIPDNASHLYAPGGLIGDMGSWNLLTNPSFEGPIGATTCAGWTEVGAVDRKVISSNQKYAGASSFYFEEGSGGKDVGFKQEVALTEGTYYASIWVWCISTAGAPDGVNWQTTGLSEGNHIVYPTGNSAWTRYSQVLNVEPGGETVTFFFGGNTTGGSDHGTFVDAASLVQGSFLSDFMTNTGMNTYVITLPQSDGYSTTISGAGRLKSVTPKASIGELQEASFEIILSGAPTWATTTP